jgi:hypothetical protein
MQSILGVNRDEGFGAITGIFLDSTESRTAKKAIDPDALWLKSRF